ncbi:hypothetical protein SAMN05660649_04371 [Desulfotomaculum arcticum]|uniref:Histidine kinase-, DNA gyrase B-, and HSP90-like ATPase n=1 Tax=Desulfotruncus arcticus DSM 17038 TaxID=1121424 RepID=A0A1I2YBW0_9FIRM|nr:ATP-binding protein [Desulfotruncus arcticus]SFH23085.1 hypothetical protein SAMN05660649_04371 [Desulfotomaculum arcticum] [Desulfotruncus arcticus DSM 17038]
MRIYLPNNLDLSNALRFCKELNTLVSEYTDYLYDYSLLSLVEPFGMLLVGSAMRKFINSHTNSNHQGCNFSGKNYAAHMGFFQSIYLDYGNRPGEANGNTRYIPITEINTNALKKEAIENFEHVGETIEKKSQDLALVLARQDFNLTEYLTYSIRELLRNIVEHSESNSIWIAGQYWPSRDLVEIAILDEGVGIRNSLRNNPHLEIDSDESALILALEPGISGVAFGKRKRPNDVWSNTGYGLYMTSQICQQGGSFVICSGSKTLLMNKFTKKIFDTSFNGTAIRMRLIASRIGNLNTVLQHLVNEGEKKARENKTHSVLSASKASKSLLSKIKP